MWGWSKPTSPGGLVGQSALCLARETGRGLLRQKGLDEEEPERTEEDRTKSPYVKEKMGVRGGAGRDIQSPSPEQRAKRKAKAKCIVGAAAISMCAPPIHFPEDSDTLSVP